jgi:hypothetical protein
VAIITDEKAQHAGERTLLTQRQAAELLQVSQAYLRASRCPKLLLPGNGPRGKPVLRYSKGDLLEWTRVRRAPASAPHRETD